MGTPPTPKDWGPGITKEDYLTVRPGDTVPRPPAGYAGLPPGIEPVDPAKIQRVLLESSRQPPVDASRFAGLTGEEVSALILREAQERDARCRAEEEEAAHTAQFTATRGKRVRIAGKAVQLPPDAGIDGEWRAEPAARSPRRAATRFVVVRQGEALALVGSGYRTRRIVAVLASPEDEQSFAWLEAVLRD